jgi:hypothetical protein
MTIALNIIVFTGVVGLLAASIIASRNSTQLNVRTATAKRRATARQRAYGSLKSANA